MVVTRTMDRTEFSGTRVLVVEDEVLISMMLVDMIEQLDCVTVGPAATIGDARPLVSAGEYDVAVLDIHVDGASVFELADQVVAKGVPVIIASGSGSDAIPDRFRNVGLLPKPYTLPALEASLREARRSVRG
jgi:DNA-binding response OmpR family regulator